MRQGFTLPPCGEVAVGIEARAAETLRAPTPALRADPPHKGEGKDAAPAALLFP